MMGRQHVLQYDPLIRFGAARLGKRLAREGFAGQRPRILAPVRHCEAITRGQVSSAWFHPAL